MDIRKKMYDNFVNESTELECKYNQHIEKLLTQKQIIQQMHIQYFFKRLKKINNLIEQSFFFYNQWMFQTNLLKNQQ